MKRTISFLSVISILLLAQLACNFGAKTSQNNNDITPISPSPLPQQNNNSNSAPTSATKSDRGTPADAQAMLKLAIQYYQTAGRAKALADFTAGKPPFKDRDLYVACIDAKLIQSANGGFPNLVGSRIEPISRAAWDAASTSSIGSVSYQWIDPANGQTEPKTFYYEKVGTDVCGVGAYNP